MTPRFASVLVAIAVTPPLAAQSLAIDAPVLPTASLRLEASAEECAVWQLEASFARSLEGHDETAFASHIHPGAVFDAGVPEFTRGGAAIVQTWSALVGGRRLALRWRPGIVHIGGDPAVAPSQGLYILQMPGAAGGDFRVGFYKTLRRG